MHKSRAVGHGYVTQQRLTKHRNAAYRFFATLSVWKVVVLSSKITIGPSTIMKLKISYFYKWQKAIPHILVVLWLAYLGTMIWHHSLQSIQPPLYDSLTYMEKAKKFWDAFDQGKWINPLNIEPTVRPPGTILMSYPLGFSPNVVGFKFRSVFFPIVCIVLAVYLSAGMPQTNVVGWGVAATALLFSSIPMFFSFDYNEITPGMSAWGLVDNFQAGIAALAAACFIKSLRSRSLLWLFWGALIASFTLMIKPSGLMVMAILFLVWLIVIVVEFRVEKKYKQFGVDKKRYMIIGGIQTVAIYLLFLIFSFNSSYFSANNFAFANQALKIMAVTLRISTAEIVYLLYMMAGISLILWLFANGVFFLYHSVLHDNIPAFLKGITFGLFLSTPLIWGIGVWYWLVVQAGGSQVRYFYPFFLMGLVCLIPISMNLLQISRRWLLLSELGLCFITVINIGVLLAMTSPPPSWQKICGVNLTVGKDRNEVNQAYQFISELRQQKKSVSLYTFNSDILSDIFVCVGGYERVIRPDLPVFRDIYMVDWVNGITVRIDQILDADYILISKHFQMAEETSNQKNDAFVSESILFQKWLLDLNNNSGLRIVSDGNSLRLLQIVDVKAFANGLESFVEGRSWRREFISANSIPEWTNAENLSAVAHNLIAKEIDFGGVYLLHGMLLHTEDSSLTVDLWWEEKRHEEENSQRYMFFHLVDSSGKILRDLSLPLNKYLPPFSNRKWKHGSVNFGSIPNDTVYLAFGIYRPNHEYLIPDKGTRDWYGKRVLVPIHTTNLADSHLSK